MERFDGSKQMTSSRTKTGNELGGWLPLGINKQPLTIQQWTVELERRYGILQECQKALEGPDSIKVTPSNRRELENWLKDSLTSERRLSVKRVERHFREAWDRFFEKNNHLVPAVNNFGMFKVDILLSDAELAKQLVNQTSQWRSYVSAIFEQDFDPNSMNKKMKSWSSYRILDVFDIHVWSKLTKCRRPAEELAYKIWPERECENVDILSKYRRAVPIALSAVSPLNLMVLVSSQNL